MVMQQHVSSSRQPHQAAADQRSARQVEGRGRLLGRSRRSSAAASGCPPRSCSASSKPHSSAGAMRCTGSPSTTAKVVRSASWRATTRSSARASAARSSAPPAAGAVGCGRRSARPSAPGTRAAAARTRAAAVRRGPPADRRSARPLEAASAAGRRLASKSASRHRERCRSGARGLAPAARLAQPAVGSNCRAAARSSPARKHGSRTRPAPRPSACRTPRDHLHRQQRVPAQLEEVVPAAHPLHAQQLRPDLAPAPARSRPPAPRTPRAAYASPSGRGERPAVHLAVRRERQRLQPHERRRHHVLRQPLAPGAPAAPPPPAGVRRPRRTPPAAGRPARPRAPPPPPRAPRVLGQPRLDLAQLDAEAADFTWSRSRPRNSSVPSGQPPRQVARAVQPRARLGAERVGDEALGGQLRAGQVAARHPAPPMYSSPATPTGTGSPAARPGRRPRVLAIGRPIGTRRLTPPAVARPTRSDRPWSRSARRG